MPRPRGVSRSLTITLVTALVVELETNTATEELLIIPHKVVDKAKALRILKKRDNAQYVVVAVKSLQTEKRLYGMSEEQFVNTAKILDPVTRKPMNN